MAMKNVLQRIATLVLITVLAVVTTAGAARAEEKSA